MSEAKKNKTKNFALIVCSLSFCLLSYAYFIKVSQPHDYKILQLGDMRRDQFLLDKKTGRNWVSVCIGETKGPDCNGELIWQERNVIGLNGFNYDNVANLIEFQKKQSTKK